MTLSDGLAPAEATTQECVHRCARASGKQTNRTFRRDKPGGER